MTPDSSGNSPCFENEDQLILHYRGLVKTIAADVATQFRLRRFMDDLVAYGEIGLLDAARRYDASKGAAFKTYAWYRIRGQMLDGCRKMGFVKRKPKRAQRLQVASAYCDVQATRLEEEEDNIPDSIEGLAVALDEMVTEAASIHLLGEAAVLDKADEGPSPEEVTVKRDTARWVRDQVDALDEETRKIISWTFFSGWTLDQVAAELGCTRSWASRLRRAALKRLKARLVRQGEGWGEGRGERGERVQKPPG